MSRTAAQLRAEVAKRLGTYVSTLVSSTNANASQLVQSTLTQYYPTPLGQGKEQWNPWFYGLSSGGTGFSSTAADAANQGVFRRGQNWDGTNTVTFLTLWPTAPTTGTYEIYEREDPTRILEAINSAVGQLSLWWSRPFVDTSITTATETWTYTLPAGQYTSRIWQISYQVDTSTVNVGFPYADAQDLDWVIRENIDVNTGALTQTLQFAVLPPPQRTLRLEGEAYFPDLVNDGDVLAIGGQWERPCLSWIYRYSLHCLQEWQALQLPVGDVQRYEEQEKTLLQEATELKAQMQKAHKPGRIVVPGRGRGLLGYPNVADNPAWIGGFHQGRS